MRQANRVDALILDENYGRLQKSFYRGIAAMKRQVVEPKGLNSNIKLPYQLRLKDFELAMQDVYDFFYDVNTLLIDRGLHRFDEMLRPAAMSGIISDTYLFPHLRRVRGKSHRINDIGCDGQIFASTRQASDLAAVSAFEPDLRAKV